MLPFHAKYEGGTFGMEGNEKLTGSMKFSDVFGLNQKKKKKEWKKKVLG